MTDEKLLNVVKKAMNGDEKAFEELCAMKGKNIIYIALRMTGDMQEAEDAAQDVMVYMYQNITRLRQAEAFNVWLYRIVRSVCCNKKRKIKYKISMLEEGEANMMEDRKDFLPYEFFEDGSKREKLLEIVDKLPEKQKMCVLLFYYENFSYLEIGNTLDLTKKEVEYALTKSRKIIRRELEKDAETRRLLEKTYAVAPVPVLAKLFLDDADGAVTGAVLQRVSDGWKGAIEGTAVASFRERGGSGRGAVKSGGTLVKATVGVMMTAGIAAGAFYYADSNRSQERDAISVEPAKVNTESVYEAENELPPQEIRTLADMIGTEPAKVLNGYTSEEALAKEAVDEFLDTHQMEPKESMWREVSMTEDTLYTLEKQDKLLMVIVRYYKREACYGVAYRFTDITEELPLDMDIVENYEAWK